MLTGALLSLFERGSKRASLICIHELTNVGRLLQSVTSVLQTFCGYCLCCFFAGAALNIYICFRLLIGYCQRSLLL